MMRPGRGGCRHRGVAPDSRHDLSGARGLSAPLKVGLSWGAQPAGHADAIDASRHLARTGRWLCTKRTLQALTFGVMAGSAAGVLAADSHSHEASRASIQSVPGPAAVLATGPTLCMGQKPARRVMLEVVPPSARQV